MTMTSIRWIAAVLLAATLAAVLSLGLAGSAHADPTVPSDTWNEIFAPFDNGHGNTMCVDVPGGSTSAGAPLQFFHCHGYASDGGPQRWHLINGNGNAWPGVGLLYLIKNIGSHGCISVAGNPGTGGGRLVQEPCGQATFWALHVQNANGTDPLFELIANGTNLCMAAGDTFDNNQTPLVARTCDGFQDAAQVLQLG